MDSTEYHLSIDHFEEKFVTYTPVLTRANNQDASSSEAVKDEDIDGIMKEAKAELENSTNKTGDCLHQEKSYQSVSSNDGAKEVEKKNIEIIMGVDQTSDVNFLAKDTNQQTDIQTFNPESQQISKLNLFLASEEKSVDQPLNVNLKDTNVISGAESELIPNEVGVLADKELVVNVDIGYKDVTYDDSIIEEHQPNVVVEAPPMATEDIVPEHIAMQTSTENIKDVCIKKDDIGAENLNTIFKSDVEKPSIDIKDQKATEVSSESKALSTISVKNPDEDVILKEERAALQSHHIEVERKFQVINFDESILLQANGKLISEVSFEDVYYDNDSYDLILKDCWLRKRNRKWEFKMPVNMDEGFLHISTAFKELEEEKDIRNALLEIIKPGVEFSENKGIIQDFKLEPFATFTTMRKSYQLPSDCKVVIDLTGFGYSVGEIEIMVKENSEIAEAVAKINIIADQLGFKMLSITELAKC